MSVIFSFLHLLHVERRQREKGDTTRGGRPLREMGPSDSWIAFSAVSGGYLPAAILGGRLVDVHNML